MPRARPQLIERLRREGYVTVPKASELTDVAERTIRTWTRTERVETKRVGGLVFVSIRSLREVAGMPVEAP